MHPGFLQRCAAFLVAGLLLCDGFENTRSVHAAELQVGDRGVIVDDDVELVLADRTKTKLERGSEFVVTEVKGTWLRGTVTIEGNTIQGWVRQNDLRRAVPAVQDLAPATDAASALAALQKIGVMVELDDDGHVQALDASELGLPEAALKYLAYFDRLTVLQLGGTPTTDAGLRHLTQLKTLEKLYLENTEVGDKGVRHLADLLSLEVLILEGTRVTGDGLAALAELKNLKTLNLTRCRLQDEDLKHLEQLTRLEVLTLPKTKITGAGFSHLKPLKQLRVLNISDNPLTDDGLELLHGQPTLKMLYIRGTSVSDESVKNLRATLTSCAIYRN